MKWPLFLIFSLLMISCGKGKSFNKSLYSNSSSEATVSNKEFQNQQVDDVECIDKVLFKELGENEKVKKVDEQADISFCNGLRIRIKILKISNGETRVYGFAESTSGRKSCLKQDVDFTKTPFLGYQGTLMGDNIKISLGGHAYKGNGKIEKSEHLKGKFVKFDVATYSGEVGFFENNKLKCWAMH